MKKRSKGLFISKEQGKYLINVNFELIILLGLILFALVSIFAPDAESKQLFAEVIDTLGKGFIGFISKGIYDYYSNPYSNSYSHPNSPENNWINDDKINYNRDELLIQKEQLENELNQINQRL